MMDMSERMERMKTNLYLDEVFSSRILALLNHPEMDKYCMVDAYYYDFSVIPRDICDSLDLRHDCYMIFGITKQGQLISKWVDRWDLDSKYTK